MIWIYLAFLLFGAVFVVPLVLGGLGAEAELETNTGSDIDSDFGSDVGSNFDVEVDAEVGADIEAAGAGDVETGTEANVETYGSDGGGALANLDATGILGDALASLVSLRSVAFFATFFGFTGTVLDLAGYHPALVGAVAASLGFIAAFGNGLAFSLVRRTQSSSHETERSFQGRRARIVVPIEPGHRGRIEIDLAGQPQFMVAEGTDPADQFGVGHPVVVVEMHQGVAAVASLEGLGLD